ncbi:MAG: aminotransferase [Alphaproteobacteria bacterium]
MQNQMDLQRFEEQHHLPPFSDFKALKKEGTRIITHAQGHMIYDSGGHAILDAMAGLWCVNVGYGRDELVNAATEQMHKLPYYNSFFKTSNEPVAKLSAKLASIAPEHLNHVIYANSGSEANDTIIRLVRHYWALKGHPEKRVIIGREYGYHGSTIMAASMGGMKAMHDQSAHEADFEHIRPPYGFLYQGNQTEAQFAESSAKLLKEKILEVGADKVAAFIAEPVQGAGGVIIPPDGYFEHIQKICNEFGILFIADEVITGFGRTGNWFASQTMDLKPDVVTLAKGLTSGYMPMSAVLVSDTIAEHLINEGGEFYHGFTYSGHPVSAAVALANLELIETEGLIEHVRDITAPYLGDAIKQLDSHPLVGETRSFGLLACIELVQHKSGPVLFDPIGEVGTLCRDNAIKGGLMVRAVRDGMILSPPLSFQTKDIDITIEKLKQALDATYAEFKK